MTLDAVRVRWRAQRAEGRQRRFPASRAVEQTLAVPFRPGDADVLWLFSVACDAPDSIRHQIRLLDKYLDDEFALTIVDNSRERASRRAVRSHCVAASVNYVALARNPHNEPSRSHGAALNWAYDRLVAPHGLRYFGFLDHDIQPCRPTRVLPGLKERGLVGLVQERGSRWYLWPGLCFFSADLVGADGLDFMPRPGLDTGGGNWESLCSRIPRDLVSPLPLSCGMATDGLTGQRLTYDVFGDWVHTGNASQWKPAPGRDVLVQRFLEEL